MMPDRVNLFYPKGNEEALKGSKQRCEQLHLYCKKITACQLGHVSAGLELEAGGLFELWRWRPVWA